MLPRAQDKLVGCLGELNPHRSRFWQKRHRTTRCAVNSRCFQGTFRASPKALAPSAPMLFSCISSSRSEVFIWTQKKNLVRYATAEMSFAKFFFHLLRVCGESRDKCQKHWNLRTLCFLPQFAAHTEFFFSREGHLGSNDVVKKIFEERRSGGGKNVKT